MTSREMPSERRPLAWAMSVSLALHALALLVAVHDPAADRAALPRLEARLAPRVQPPAAVPPAVTRPRPVKSSDKPAPRRRIITAEKSRGPAVASTPRWSAAEKAEMDRFLDELAGPTAAPPPPLAQRALAMARQQARQLAQQDAAGEAVLEPRPNATPADPFSLDMYLDGLIKRLNRSAGFVRNDPRSAGLRPAAVRFRLNPDGSLHSFVVLNAGDQADEIAFIKAVVEQAAPFSPFPPDIERAARSLGVTICIQPGRGGGFGFTRKPGGRGC